MFGYFHNQIVCPATRGQNAYETGAFEEIEAELNYDIVFDS